MRGVSLRPLISIAQLFNTMPIALAGAERVFEILDEVPEITDGPDHALLEHIQDG
jgi:ATP-binding cassette subfamily B protein